MPCSRVSPAQRMFREGWQLGWGLGFRAQTAGPRPPAHRDALSLHPWALVSSAVTWGREPLPLHVLRVTGRTAGMQEAREPKSCTGNSPESPGPHRCQRVGVGQLIRDLHLSQPPGISVALGVVIIIRILVTALLASGSPHQLSW